MNQTKLDKIVSDHQLWLKSDENGKKADLRHADLRHADLRHANLRWADLRAADLRHADLRHANLRHANLRAADLHEADLRAADLHEADLYGADLHGADLRRAIGNNAELKTIQAGKYQLTYTATTMAISCQQHSIVDWFEFDDKTIDKMDTGALEWWQIWKPILQQIIAAEV